MNTGVSECMPYHMAERGGQMEIKLSVRHVQGSNVGPDNCYSEVFLLFPSLHAGKCWHIPSPTQLSYIIGVTFFKKLRSHFQTLSPGRVKIEFHTVDPILCSTL
jgi:hypothetical protein